MSLNPQVVRYQVEQLKLRHPDLFGDEDNWDLTLASETDLDEALASLVAQERHTAALVEALAIQRAEMKARSERLQQRADAIRELMLSLMNAANVSKRELPIATVSIRKGSITPDIPDDGAVPPEFCTFKVVTAPDRALIKEHLQAGGSVNWATLKEGAPGITVRTK